MHPEQQTPYLTLLYFLYVFNLQVQSVFSTLERYYVSCVIEMVSCLAQKMLVCLLKRLS
jgi:hypothetical protein